MSLNPTMIIIIAALSVSYAGVARHIMKNLILIEYMATLVIFSLFSVLGEWEVEFYLVLYFMVLLITESLIGLSLMINMVRTHGNDYLQPTLTIKL